MKNGALRYFASIKNGTTPATGEPDYWGGEIGWATPEDLGKVDGVLIVDTKRRVTEKALLETNLALLPVGSVLISTRAPIGHMAITGQQMAFNQGCRGLVPSEQLHGPYLYYLLKSRTEELNGRANGTTFVELSRDELASVQISIPPLETQRRIACFLDEKTGRIDTLIAKKRELLDRLAEKRQALITRAVTRGLDPDVPLEPSGVDWLGDVPAHWEIKRLRHLVGLASGATPTTGVGEYWDGDIPWISPKDMKSDVLSDSIDKVTELAVNEYGLRCFTDPNVVLVVRGMILARRVPVALAKGRYTINQDMKVLKSQGQALPAYLRAYLSSIEGYLQTLIGEAGHGTKALRTDVLLDTPVLIPSHREQKQITDYVEQRTREVDAISRKHEKLLDHLTEYRAALITAAVTGKLAIDAAPPAPDETA